MLAGGVLFVRKKRGKQRNAVLESSSVLMSPPVGREPDKSVQEILSLVERDLLQAKNLVAPFDTLPDKSMLVAEKRIKNNWVSSSVTDLFFLYRGFRMNYYAVIAQLARVYNYMGEYEKAAHCAQEVLDAYAEEYAAVCFQLSKKELSLIHI